MNIASQHQHARATQNELLKVTEELEKFKQQTEYVCLKLAVKDWITFLAEVRKGYILRAIQTTHSNPSNPSNVPTAKSKNKDQAANTIKKMPNAYQLLNEVLEIKSTKRNTCKNHICDCESPIFSEEKIKHIKGSDTSRSESSCGEVPTLQQQDPFEKYKLEHICAENQLTRQVADELIKKFEEHDRNQKSKEPPMFDTFRKPISEEKNGNNQIIMTSSRTNHQSTAKKNYSNSNIHEQQPSCFARVNSDEWINKQTVDIEQGMKQFLLALENTKLRKQIKYLQKMLNSQVQSK